MPINTFDNYKLLDRTDGSFFRVELTELDQDYRVGGNAGYFKVWLDYKIDL